MHVLVVQFKKLALFNKVDTQLLFGKLKFQLSDYL